MALEFAVPAVLLTLLITVHVFVKERAIVAGKVFDDKKNPATNAQVRIGRAVTYTDSSGQFQFCEVPFGDHVLSIRRGVVEKQRPIQIRRHSLVVYETIQ